MSPSVTVRLLATQSDARLVELAGRGHERAFEALVQRYRRPLLGYCRRVLLPEARAEDALQQALLQAWLALQRGDEVRDARAWLYRIVHNTALNALRGSGYDYAELSEAISGAGAPQEDLDRRIAVREALAGLAALPEQQREALLRTAVEGASHATAAAEMGLSEGALRGLVYRARATLRTAATAITPMPFASWAADAAGHGGGAVTDLAVGGGSAGLAGLLAKGGAAAISAGVLAAGVGAVAEHHGRAHAASHPAHAVRVAAREAGGAAHAGGLLAVAAPSASTTPGAPSPRRDGHSHRHGHGHGTATAQAPAAPIHPRAGERADGGGGTPPRQGTSEGDDGHGGLGGGTGPGGRQGRGRLPGSGTAPAPGSGGDDGSGDDGHSGASGGGSDDGGGSGGSGSSGGDGGHSSGDTGSQGDSGGGGAHDSGGSSGGDSASSGSDSSGGSASDSGGSGG